MEEIEKAELREKEKKQAKSYRAKKAKQFTSPGQSRGNSLGKTSASGNKFGTLDQVMLPEEEELVLSTDRKLELDKMMCDGKEFFGKVNKELKMVTKELTNTRMGCQVSK